METRGQRAADCVVQFGGRRLFIGMFDAAPFAWRRLQQHVGAADVGAAQQL